MAWSCPESEPCRSEPGREQAPRERRLRAVGKLDPGVREMRPEHRKLLGELRPARRVLVVDDHPSFRRCARALLGAEGFEVVGEAEDGASAVALTAELEPELVLLDVQLPDLDGFEVTSRLLSRDPQLEVVLVSSRDSTEYGDLVETSGARGFISKGDLSGTALDRLLR